MEESESIDLAGALQRLQSWSRFNRKAAAARLGEFSLNPADYPHVPPEKLTEFEGVIKEAAAAAVDQETIKRFAGLSASFPGWAPVLILLFVMFTTPIRPGALFWAAAVVWMAYWWLRTTRTMVRTLGEPARQAIKLGRELGVLSQHVS